VKASFVAQTDVGLKRKENEDSYLVDESNCIFVVADGMGGHAAGDLASRVAVECICDFLRQNSAPLDEETAPFGIDPELSDIGNRMKNAIQLANQKIRQIATNNEQVAGMGTTVVCAHIEGHIATIANVGDSRAYLFRQSGFRQISDDHSWVNEQLQKKLITPDDARVHPWRNVITRALGSRELLEVDVFTERIRAGDQLLICTDGLSGMLDDISLFEILTDTEITQEEKSQRLIDEAKKAGGADNITQVLIAFMDE
jgi:protein phosphatase